MTYYANAIVYKSNIKMEASKSLSVKDTQPSRSRTPSLQFLLRLDRLNSNMVSLADHMRVLMESLSHYMVDPATQRPSPCTLKTINKLPCAQGKGEICTVRTEPMHGKMKKLPCGHLYHKK